MRGTWMKPGLGAYTATALLLALGGCGDDGAGGSIVNNNGQLGGNGAPGTMGGDGGMTTTTGGGMTSGTGGNGTQTTGDGMASTGDDVILEEGDCAAISRNSPEAKGGVDVVFLLDTSGSMLHAITQVGQNLAAFIQDFEGTDADTRVVMITNNDPAAGSPVANQPDRYRFIQSEVDSQMLYTVALAQFGNYQDFLRPNAATQFVMITDDNDSLPPATFRQEMENALGKSFTVHSIASEDFMGTPCYSESAGCPVTPGIPPIPAVCGAIAIGTAYNELAAQTGGVQASVCTADWTPVFEQLKAAVIEAVPLPCDYPLKDASSDTFNPREVQIRYQSQMRPETEFPLTEEGASGCGDAEAWYYDDPENPQVIHLCPKACEAVSEGGKIDLVFGCPPTVLI